ncbi:Protein of unknown function [Psychrobacillus sp. OK028]|uniref:DUF3006 domain-containing protein n=1 Tax=Psychrobacillus sp. OK028 TaxID=1884359 RepID=UPI00088794D8|nr:DUF3006 domain-containing protein [Psychrobacillus sp. OK028]SDM59363.1 Protein of unknown function [Psychrobacillus sp. OK028]
MKGIVDRFEGNIVVIEINGETQDISKDIVNSDVKVSDVVELVNGKWVSRKEETDKRKKEIKSLMDSVWED